MNNTAGLRNILIKLYKEKGKKNKNKNREREKKKRRAEVQIAELKVEKRWGNNFEIC